MLAPLSRLVKSDKPDSREKTEKKGDKRKTIEVIKNTREKNIEITRENTNNKREKTENNLQRKETTQGCENKEFRGETTNELKRETQRTQG